MKRVYGTHTRVIAPAGYEVTFEEMSLRWRAVGNTESDLTGPRFDPKTSRCRDECVITPPIIKNMFKVGLKFCPKLYPKTYFLLEKYDSVHCPDYIREVGREINRVKGLFGKKVVI